jgi:class 3 adenylate cyclase
MWGRIRALIDPGVPEPVDARAFRRLLVTTLVLDLFLVATNIGSRWGLGPRGDVAAYDVFLAFNLPGHAVAIGGLIAALRSAKPFEDLRLTSALIIAGLGWTMVVATWLVGGLAVMINIAFSIVMIGAVRLYLGWRLGLVAVVLLIISDALLASLRVADLLPQRSPFPDYVLDNGTRAAAVVVLRAVAEVVMFVLAGYAANRYRVAEHRLRRYMAPQLADELITGDQDPSAQRDRRAVTVLFADIRGFTSLVERLEPDVLASALNRWFDEVSQVASAHGGTIDKFIGDAIMVVFGAPRATGEADQAQRGVRLARAIQSTAAALRPEFAKLGVEPFEVRIGVGSGVATVGSFGAAHRADYTAVGVPVNRAARLESMAPPGRVLIDERTRELVGDAARVEPFGEVALKGFAKPQAAFLLLDSPPP